MRKLTIKRDKSYAASLIKMKIYIEDASANELTINDVPCRKLGIIKNGEEKIFEIGEEAAKIFVIQDKLSRNISNEFYNLPAGTEDVSLAGKNEWNPSNGNAFRFYNNDTAETLQNRKKGSKKFGIVLAIAVAVGIIIGLAPRLDLFPTEPKTFSESGMSITLTDDFSKKNVEPFTCYFKSKDFAVMAQKEDFSLFDDADVATPEDYAYAMIYYHDISDTTVTTQDGLTWFEYVNTNEKNNTAYHYFAFIYKTADAFWCIQIAAEDIEKTDEYRDQFIEWAKTVTFEQPAPLSVLHADNPLLTR